jgi:hypothetical protein
VGWTQIIFGLVLVAVLVAVAGYYGWRQVGALRRLRQLPDLPDEEQRYLRGQARRRLAISALLLLLAILLAGDLLFLEAPSQQLADEHAPFTDAGQEPVWTDQTRFLARLYGIYMIVFLLVLLAALVLAGIEFWSIRRYGLRELRKLQADRRAMIRRQIARLHQERDERN